ncbi:thioredoxin reductase Trr1 [Schizosaccharomyces cryophilus OY26]|uniref:Thioredoxin reductase n=1 Tax=Schizosaccharomyces cryophilus (strain OY26 / ATCC MYA-4695 / CBS 11777 / NBRC 106824 / NRRL Y48691) TaxID=653667 RepID=S9X0B2_SCHCR|nr:thioredoxin reductase Trr1 [Schizosaccharomyces cryophilus OY26]EPY50387.1 thioredoxin reductase Trr1 [Schizosaccharomyces cryophilus OY26]
MGSFRIQLPLSANIVSPNTGLYRRLRLGKTFGVSNPTSYSSRLSVPYLGNLYIAAKFSHISLNKQRPYSTKNTLFGSNSYCGAAFNNSSKLFSPPTLTQQHTRFISTDFLNNTEMSHSKVVIIGSGPAGHTAAIYLSRGELSPVMYEGMLANGIAAGGQLTTTTDVENFPGFPEGVNGTELTEKFRAQSERFGTTIISETISKLDLSSRPFKFWLEGAEDGAPNTADCVILATGASARRLHISGEDKYWQAGISACAVCDGAVPIFRNKPLAVVGGGDSAAEEAQFLTKYGSKVYVLVRRDKLRASPIMAKRLLSNPKVEVLWNTVAEEAQGDGKLLNNLRLKNTITGDTSDLNVSGLFYAIGHIPATDLVKGQVELDAEGYVQTINGTPRTSIPGFFAAGDVQDKVYRQAITSAGSGCQAALLAMNYVEDLEEEKSN